MIISYISEFVFYFFKIKRLHGRFARYHVLTRSWRHITLRSESFPFLRSELHMRTSSFKRDSIRTVVTWPWTLRIRRQRADMLSSSNRWARTFLHLRWHCVRRVVRWTWTFRIWSSSKLLRDVVPWSIVGGGGGVILIWSWALSALQTSMLYLKLSQSISDCSWGWFI